MAYGEGQRPVRAKASFILFAILAFALAGRRILCHLPQGVALGYMLLGFQPDLE
jgi:hypothetical protein